MTRMHRAILATLACSLVPLSPLEAQVAPSVWPRCIPERDGQQLGQAGSVCECGYERGGTMTGKPPGWRWACDILRSDGSNLDSPADTSAGRQSLPPGFVYAPQNGAGIQPIEPGQSFGQPYGMQQRGPMPLFGGRR